VVLKLLWPASFWMAAAGAPFLASREQNVCLSV
jgi:hypothetical protein